MATKQSFFHYYAMNVSTIALDKYITQKYLNKIDNKLKKLQIQKKINQDL